MKVDGIKIPQMGAVGNIPEGKWTWKGLADPGELLHVLCFGAVVVSCTSLVFTGA